MIMLLFLKAMAGKAIQEISPFYKVSEISIANGIHLSTLDIYNK